jgi:hypothetical protein
VNFIGLGERLKMFRDDGAEARKSERADVQVQITAARLSCFATGKCTDRVVLL